MKIKINVISDVSIMIMFSKIDLKKNYKDTQKLERNFYDRAINNCCLILVIYKGM